MKIRILIIMLLAATVSVNLGAEEKPVPKPIKKETPPGTNQGNRAPAILPVEIVYNTETSVIRITSWGDIEGEVYILNSNEEVENYSPTLACELTVPSSGVHSIYIQGDGWYASTEFEN